MYFGWFVAFEAEKTVYPFILYLECIVSSPPFHSTWTRAWSPGEYMFSFSCSLKYDWNPEVDTGLFYYYYISVIVCPLETVMNGVGEGKQVETQSRRKWS